MYFGTVKWFNEKKGFGFIRPDDGGSDVFVHITALQKSNIDTLHENQAVTYDLEKSRGKESAVNIKKI